MIFKCTEVSFKKRKPSLWYIQTTEMSVFSFLVLMSLRRISGQLKGLKSKSCWEITCVLFKGAGLTLSGLER